MSAPIPASLVKSGISSFSDNLPTGAGLDIARDFVRVFRAEIERKAFGWQQPFGRPHGEAPCPPPVSEASSPCR